MNKNRIYTIIGILIVGTLFWFFFNKDNSDIYRISGNFSNEKLAEIMNDLKTGCELYNSENEKYQNEVFDIEFNYSNDVVVCEKFLFNNEEDGMELNIWEKTDFKSLVSINGPKAIIYINKAITLNPDILRLYELDNFLETNLSISDVKVFKKEIQEKTCKKDECIFNVYKFDKNKNKFLIKAYGNIENIFDNY